MTTHQKPEGYPFLRIARQYGLDYTAVLVMAQYWDDRNYKSQPPNEQERAAFAQLKSHDRYADIVADTRAAHNVQAAIRRGEIHWQTGEPITVR